MTHTNEALARKVEQLEAFRAEVQSICESGKHRTMHTQSQMCGFLDGIRFAALKAKVEPQPEPAPPHPRSSKTKPKPSTNSGLRSRATSNGLQAVTQRCKTKREHWLGGRWRLQDDRR